MRGALCGLLSDIPPPSLRLARRPVKIILSYGAIVVAIIVARVLIIRAGCLTRRTANSIMLYGVVVVVTRVAHGLLVGSCCA